MGVMKQKMSEKMTMRTRSGDQKNVLRNRKEATLKVEQQSTTTTKKVKNQQVIQMHRIGRLEKGLILC